jgi:hypothetical protein
MRQYFNYIAGLFNSLAACFVVEKKKAVLAICLITLMIFMWVRVLKNKTTPDADAQLSPSTAVADNVPQVANVTFVELPRIKGRNDRLTRDFFAVENWQNFLSGGERQTAANLRDADTVLGSTGEISRRIAEKLKLEVIDFGEKPQAFINNKLLSVSDKLTVSEGGKLYECEVVKIEKDMVLMKCGQVEIKLKLAQTAEVTDRTVKN